MRNQKSRNNKFIKVIKIFLFIFLCFNLFANSVWASEKDSAQTVEAGNTDTQQSETKVSDSETIKISLDQPSIETVAETSKGTVRFTWNKVKGATGYTIYRATDKNGAYKEIGSTKKTMYTDKSGKALHTYYYKIMAVGKDKAGDAVQSKLSKARKAEVRKKAKKVAYVGDSIFTGFPLYGVLRNTGSHKVYAKVGINTKSFLGSDLMRKLLQYNPDRMFIMLGVNSLPGNATSRYMDYILEYYEKIIKQCLKKNPDMEIIIIGVAPVSRSANVRLSKVHRFNKKLKKMFGTSKYKGNVHYCSLDSVLGDKSGYLPSKYSAGDGVHWKKAAYEIVLKALNDFVKEF